MPTTIPIRPFQVGGRLKAGRGPIAKLDFVILRLHTADGLVGTGDTVVMPTLSGQTVEKIRHTLEVKLAPRLLGRSPLELGAIHAMARELAPGAHVTRSVLDIVCSL